MSRLLIQLSKAHTLQLHSELVLRLLLQADIHVTTHNSHLGRVPPYIHFVSNFLQTLAFRTIDDDDIHCRRLKHDHLGSSQPAVCPVVEDLCLVEGRHTLALSHTVVRHLEPFHGVALLSVAQPRLRQTDNVGKLQCRVLHQVLVVVSQVHGIQRRYPHCFLPVPPRSRIPVHTPLIHLLQLCKGILVDPDIALLELSHDADLPDVFHPAQHHIGLGGGLDTSQVDGDLGRLEDALALDLVSSHSKGHLDGELEDVEVLWSLLSEAVVPGEPFHSSCVRISLCQTWVPLPPFLSNIWILELDHQPLDLPVGTLDSVHKLPQLSVAQAVRHINVADQHHRATLLQHQLVHKVGFSHLPSCIDHRLVVWLESVAVLSLEHHFFSLHLSQFSVIDFLCLCIRADYGGGNVLVPFVTLLEHPLLQHFHVLLRVALSPHSQQQVSICLVISLSVVDLQVDHLQHLPPRCHIKHHLEDILLGPLEDIVAEDRSQLQHVSKAHQADPAKRHSPPILHLLQPEIELVEHVPLHHGNFVNDDQLEVAQLSLLAISVSVR